MKVWFEGNRIYYDAVINGFTPNFITLDTKINDLEFDGKHVYIKGTPHDAVIYDLDNAHKTRCEYKENNPFSNREKELLQRLEMAEMVIGSTVKALETIGANSKEEQTRDYAEKVAKLNRDTLDKMNAIT